MSPSSAANACQPASPTSADKYRAHFGTPSQVGLGHCCRRQHWHPPRPRVHQLRALLRRHPGESPEPSPACVSDVAPARPAPTRQQQSTHSSIPSHPQWYVNEAVGQGQSKNLFYTHPNCKLYYKKYVNMLINRRNTVTGESSGWMSRSLCLQVLRCSVP